VTQSSADITDVTMANRALAQVRSRPIASFDDQDERTRAVVATYWNVLEAALTMRKWYFARGFEALTAAPESKRRGWDHAHLLPANRIGPPFKLTNSPKEDRAIRVFELTEDCVLSDEPQVYGLFYRRTRPVFWPGYFRIFITTALASAFAITVRNDETMSQQKAVEAFGGPSLMGQGGLFKTAADLDHAHRPPEEVTAGDAFLSQRDVGSGNCHFMKF
jgi:hypothetical protein